MRSLPGVAGESLIMGYERHHCIVVTSWNERLLAEAHQFAVDLFAKARAAEYPGEYPGMRVSEVVLSAVNGVASFFVPPDGSTEGCSESETGDHARNAFIAWLNAHRYDDGSTSLDWVEIQYGDDKRQPKITRHSDEITSSARQSRAGSNHSPTACLPHPLA